MVSQTTKAIAIQYLSLHPWGGADIEQYAHSRISDIAKQLNLSLSFIEASDTRDVFSQMMDLSASYENILIFHTSAPFVFPSLAQEILQKQEQFLVDYTFAEYLPWGLAPMAIRRDILEQLVPSLENKEYSPLLIDQHIKNDLNSYDIEIVLADDDYRFLKESLIATDLRSFSIVKRLFSQNLPTTSVGEFLRASLPFIRTTPSFVEIALVEDPDRKALFGSPVSSTQRTNLDLSYLSKILPSLWSENPSLTTQISLQDGEPCSHPHFAKFLEFVASYPHHHFILETFGEGLKPHWDKIQNLSNLNIVFYLGATTEETYKTTHALSNLLEKENLLEYHLKYRPHHTYIQWVRMQENEPELAIFLKRWQAFEKNILISQYNDFSGTLAERKVVDFSPLKRFPCFKLLRDLYIRADGNISLCSVDKDHIVKDSSSNFSADQWEDLWKTLGNIYTSHATEHYPEKCKNCDYWYIFNL